MNLFLKLFYYITLQVGTRLIFKKESLLLFGCSNNLFKGNPKYMYLYLCLKNKKQYNFFWVTESKAVLAKLHQKNYPVLYKRSLRAVWMLIRAKYVIIENTQGDVSMFASPLINFNINFIQTWHGTNQKLIGKDKALHKKIGLSYIVFSSSFLSKIFIDYLNNHIYPYKLICTTSEYDKRIIEKAFLNDRVKITGYPRNDLFFRSELSFENIKSKLKTYKENKIWLYAPTYKDKKHKKPKIPLSQAEYEELDTIMKQIGGVFLVKKHPVEKAIKVPPNLSHVKDFSMNIIDIQEILPHCHGLITDFSSVCTDYVLLNRPVIYYLYDEEYYKMNCNTFYEEPRELFPGPFADNANELFDHIKSMEQWFYDDKYQKKYNAFKEKFNKYHEGGSIERVFREIESI